MSIDLAELLKTAELVGRNQAGYRYDCDLAARRLMEAARAIEAMQVRDAEARRLLEKYRLHEWADSIADDIDRVAWAAPAVRNYIKHAATYAGRVRRGHRQGRTCRTDIPQD